MRAAFLIIDVQKDYFKNGLFPIKKAKEIIPIINKIKNDYPNKFTSIYISQIKKDPDHISLKESSLLKDENLHLDKLTENLKGKFPKFCIKDTEGSQLNEEIILNGNEFFINKNEDKLKEEISCFSNKNFIENLKENKIQIIFICGLTLDFCVGLTALNSSKFGFETYVIREGVKSYNEESGKSMEKNLEKNNVKIINMEQFEEIIKKVDKEKEKKDDEVKDNGEEEKKVE